MVSIDSMPVVALDANVLFAYPLRDTLLYAVEAELYQPAWSDEIWDEVIRNLEDPKRKHPHSHDDTQRLMQAIRRSFPSAFIDGYQSLIPIMEVHPKDRHVAAMAVHAGARILVTYNRKHFPSAALAPYDMEVQSPDEFLYYLYVRTPLTLVQVVQDQAIPLHNPPKTPHDILDALEMVHVTRFAQAIRRHLAAG